MSLVSWEWTSWFSRLRKRTRRRQGKTHPHLNFFSFLFFLFAENFNHEKKRTKLLNKFFGIFLSFFSGKRMGKETQITLRTRHIHCFYCIGLAFFILAVVLLALSSEQGKVLANQQNRTPVIISASIILLLAVIIFIWITYYTIGYCRLKKHEQLNRFQKQQQNFTPRTTPTPVVTFGNAAFTMDDPLANDSPTINIEMSAWWTWNE